MGRSTHSTYSFPLVHLSRLLSDLCSAGFRELAFQIADQFMAFGKPVNLRYVIVVGGMGEDCV